MVSVTLTPTIAGESDINRTQLPGEIKSSRSAILEQCVDQFVHSGFRPEFVRVRSHILGKVGRGRVDVDRFGIEKHSRRARLMELDPKYADLAVRRWQKFSGGTARLERDGRTFDQVALERAG